MNKIYNGLLFTSALAFVLVGFFTLCMLGASVGIGASREDPYYLDGMFIIAGLWFGCLVIAGISYLLAWIMELTKLIKTKKEG